MAKTVAQDRLGYAAHAALIGRRGWWHVNGIAVDVTIGDARHAFGRLDYQIAPTAGTGRVWVSAESVTVLPAEFADVVAGVDVVDAEVL